MRKALSLLCVIAATCVAADAQEPRYQLFAGIQPGASYSSSGDFASNLGYVVSGEYFDRRGYGFGLQLSFAPGSGRFSGDRWASDATLVRDLLPEASGYRLYTGGGLRWATLSITNDPGSFFGDPDDLFAIVAVFGYELNLSESLRFRLETRAAPIVLNGDASYFSREEITTGLVLRW